MKHNEQLPVDDLVQIDGICAQFESAIQTDPAVTVEPFLGQGDSTAGQPAGTAPLYRARLLKELLALEIEYRRQHGQSPTQAEYVSRFPDDAQLIQELFHELQRPEPLDNVQSDGQLSHAAHGDRALRIRCPHCRQAMQIVEDGSLSDVQCPSCGSHFDLIGDDPTVTHSSGQPRTLGHFELLETVGVGQFGAVWKARDTQLARTVAVKIPRKGALAATESEAFFREARAAAQLRHPNIVSVHEAGREGDTIYMVSDFVDGASLRDWLTAQRPSVHESVELCIKVAEALHHGHEAGVIHRDLKPANIMIDRAGEPHVTDFGLAKRESGEITMTVDGQLLGTPAYMPPEQARGEAHRADRRSDVYSLGVILFEMLTGELPFRGEQRMLIVQILNEEPPSPRKFDQRIPRDVETICLRCLQKDPSRRYQTARDLAEDSGRFLAGEPIHARPISRMERTWRWCKRKPLVSSLAAGLALALVIGSAVSTYFALMENERASELLAAQNDLIESRDEARNLASQEATAREKEANARRTAEEAERRTRRLLYLSDMREALAAKKDFNVGLIRTLLARHVPSERAGDLRGFEWFHLWSFCHRYTRELYHGSDVWAVAITHDGSTVATADVSGEVKIWNTKTGRRIGEASFGRTVRSLAFSPDGRSLAIGSNQSDTLPIWNIGEDGTTHLISGPPYSFASVAFAPDGKLLAAGSGAAGDHTVRLYDTQTWKQINSLTSSAGAIWSVAFSPNGEQIAAAVGQRPNVVKVWNLVDNELVAALQGPTRHIWDVDWSPDGSWVAAASGDRTVRVWDVASGQEIATIPEHEQEVIAVRFSPDGDYLFSAGHDRVIRVWDGHSFEPVGSLPGHEQHLPDLDISADGRWLVSASSDFTAKLWELPKCIHRRIRTTGDGPHFAFLPDAKRIVAADSEGRLHVWNAANGQSLLAFDQPHTRICGLAASPDGQRVATFSRLGAVRIWNANTGVLETQIEYTDKFWINRVVFSPDSGMLAAATRGGNQPVWDVHTGKLVDRLRTTGGICGIDFSKDGRLLAAGGANTRINFWEIATGRRIGLVDLHEDEVFDARFSPEDRLLASCSRDGAIRVNQADEHGNFALLSHFRAHAGRVQSIGFSPDGKLLASAGTDRTVRIWNLATGEEQARFIGDARFVQVAFSPDGRFLAASDANMEIHRWEAPQAEEVDAHLAGVVAMLDRTDAVRVFEHLTKVEKRDDLIADLAASYQRQGDAHRQRREHHQAIDRYTQSIETLRTVGKADPSILRQLATALGNRAYVLSLEDRFAEFRRDIVAAGHFYLELSSRDDQHYLSDQYALNLNNVAWQLVVAPDEPARDGEAALRFASRACELTNQSAASYIDTVAAAYAEVGDFASAVKWQTKAVDMCPESEWADYSKRLDLYLQEQPCRQPRDAELWQDKMSRVDSLELLAQTAYTQGEVGTALAHRKTANSWLAEILERSPTDRTAQDAMAYGQVQLAEWLHADDPGQNAEAIEQCRQADLQCQDLLAETQNAVRYRSLHLRILLRQAELHDALGETTIAEPLYRQAIEVGESVFAENPRYTRCVDRLTRAYLGAALAGNAEPTTEALDQHRKKIVGRIRTLWTELAPASRGATLRTRWRTYLEEILEKLLARRRVSDAVWFLHETTELLQLISADDLPDMDEQAELAEHHFRVARLVQPHAGDEAVASYQKAIEFATPIVDAKPDLRRLLIDSYGFIAAIHRSQNRTDDAIDALEKAVEHLAAAEDATPEYLQGKAYLWRRLGDLYEQKGQRDDAIACYKRAVATHEETLRIRPENTDWYKPIFWEHGRMLSWLEESDDKLDQALAVARRIIEWRNSLVQQMPNDSRARYDLALSQTRLAALLARAKRIEEAESQYQQCINAIQELIDLEPKQADYLRGLRRAYAQLAALLQTQDRNDEADQIRDKIRQLNQQLDSPIGSTDRENGE